MKRIFISISMAALALLSACQTILPEEEETPHVSVSGGAGQDVQYFTAAIGTDTKTTVEYDASRNVYKTVWSENDRIIVINADTGEYESCQIVEGAGTNVAKFAGTMNADHYYAVYSENVGLSDDGLPSVYLSSYQYSYYSLHDGLYPMFAQSSSKSFSFQNLCSLIKINVTGTEGDYLNYISLEANSSQSYMNGRAQIYMSGNEPQLDFLSGSPELTVSVIEPLYATERSVYVVLPSQTYRGGFKLTFNLDSGIKTINITDDVVMRRSRIRNLNVNLADGSYTEPAKSFSMEITTDQGNSWENFYQNDERDGLLVFTGIYMPAGAEFRFFENSEARYYGCSADYKSSNHKTNTRVNLVSEGEWWWFYNNYAGYYDIYVDPVECCVFVMSSGRTPDSLPTTYLVLHESYNTISYLSENELVKVHGVVLAKNAFGFILAVDGYYRNNVFVYDPYNRYNDITLGCWVDLYATAQTYNGLKELAVDDNSCWWHVVLAKEYDYDPEAPLVIQELSSYESAAYDYVSVTGILEIGTESTGKPYYLVHVNGQEPFQVLISQPLQEIDQFNGKNVIVEGYNMGKGTYNSAPTLKVMLKRIWDSDSLSGGSTEDVLPGGPITVTNK